MTGVKWRRLLGEAVLVVVSVYVAIVLEGMSDDRARAADADEALAYLLAELREDRRDLTVVLEQQSQQGALYGDLRRWFSEPATMPLDSVGEALDLVAYLSLTLYPRNSSWTMMVSGGQLSFVSDPALVAELADLYENAYERLEVINARYDESFIRITEESASRLWDSERRRLITADPEAIAVFRSELRAIDSWSQFYRDLLDEYAGRIDGLIADVEGYLEG